MRKEKLSKNGWLAFLTAFTILVIEGLNLGSVNVSLSSIMSDFEISSTKGGLVTTFVTGGLMIGGILGGWMSDRFGRVKMTALSVGFAVPFSVGVVLSHGLGQFLFCEFLTSVGLGGAYSCGVVLVAEYVPMARRNTFLGIIQAASAIGYIISSLASGIIIPSFGWKPMFLFVTGFSIATVLMIIQVPEPATYLSAKKNTGKKNNEFKLLLENKVCRTNLMKWVICSVTLMAGFYAANSWLPTYLTQEIGVNFKAMTVYIAGNYLMMFLGKTLTGMISDKFGRRKSWFVLCICTAVILPVVITWANAKNVGYMILLFGLFYGGPMALTATFMNESYPTECRATGVALSYNLGRIGSMTAPVLLGFLKTATQSFTLGFFVLALCYLISGFGILDLERETV